MRVGIERVRNRFQSGYEISTEYHDGIVYCVPTMKEALKRYSEERGTKITKVTPYDKETEEELKEVILPVEG